MSRRDKDQRGGRRFADQALAPWEDTHGFTARRRWVQAHLRRFWHVWGRDVWLVLTTIVAMWAAITGYQASNDAKRATTKAAVAASIAAKANAKLADTAKKAAAQAQSGCERSRKLSPPFIKIMEQAHLDGVITEDEVNLYRQIIPKRC